MVYACTRLYLKIWKVTQTQSGVSGVAISLDRSNSCCQKCHDWILVDFQHSNGHKGRYIGRIWCALTHDVGWSCSRLHCSSLGSVAFGFNQVRFTDRQMLQFDFSNPTTSAGVSRTSGSLHFPVIFPQAQPAENQHRRSPPTFSTWFHSALSALHFCHGEEHGTKMQELGTPDCCPTLASLVGLHFFWACFDAKAEPVFIGHCPLQVACELTKFEHLGMVQTPQILSSNRFCLESQHIRISYA